MKVLIFTSILFALMSSQSYTQYHRYPHYRPAPRVYGHPGYRAMPYRYYRHTPYHRVHRHTVAYTSYQYYQYFVSNGWGHYLYKRSWFMYQTHYANGYHYHNNYPYFAYNGYLHRYSTVDRCVYQLVNRAHQVLSTRGGRCDIAYNQCAAQRDAYNYRAGSYQFFCAETLRRR